MSEYFTDEQMAELLFAYKIFFDFSVAEWIKSDDLQFIRKIEERTYEAVQVMDEFPSNEDVKYSIYSDKICLDNYEPEQIQEILESFVYKSVDYVKTIYGDAAEQIIAECIFETEATCNRDTHYYDTVDEALTYAITKFDLTNE